MTQPGPHQHLELRYLAERYASGVDRRDRVLFLSAFLPDARLRVFNPSETSEPSEMRGHDAIGKVTTRIAKYDRTFHLIGNSRYEVDGASATGEVYCLAHHLDRTGTPVDHVMHIRYVDEYRRADGGWKIADRSVLVDWTESRPVSAST
ncbi:MAG: nuclear transport factor 2 family protein [Acidimicrobiia bacterium]